MALRLVICTKIVYNTGDNSYSCTAGLLGVLISKKFSTTFPIGLTLFIVQGEQKITGKKSLDMKDVKKERS